MSRYVAVQSLAALGRGSALTSRLVQQAIPVVDVCVENSLAHPLQTLYVLNRLDGTTGPCLGNSEANLALQEKQPLGLGDPALVSPFPEDFLISRRFLHGLNPFQERICQFIRIAQPHCKYVAVQSLAALGRGSALIRSAIRPTSCGKSASGTSVSGASGTSPIPAFRKDSTSFCQRRTTR